MPLRFSPAPATARQSVLTALNCGSGTGPARLRPELALPVHEITGMSRQGPPRTSITGWRFLLGPTADGSREVQPVTTVFPAMVSAAETTPAPGGWAFAHFRGGPYVSATVRALAQAETLPLPYQPRLLSVPELYMVTLWLHSAADADPAAGFPDAADMVIPLAPAPPGIASHQPQRVDTLLPLLTHRLGSVPMVHT
ncbi:hypothetical protein N566_26275 [Streptomycetaceae bacterium MP113-05]|nr:hypothetical protein N566_26275 [Streptomycetaceae bacterium MP113-05]